MAETWILIYTEDNNPKWEDKDDVVECNCYGIKVEAEDEDDALDKLESNGDAPPFSRFVDAMPLADLQKWQTDYNCWVYH